MTKKSLIKTFVPQNSIIYRISRKWYYSYQKQWSFDILNAYANFKRHVKFIQIGSNDGMDGDPVCGLIKQNNWEGILVEPVPHLFERLKNNYSSLYSKLHFENSAIANENGRLIFYSLKKSDLPNLPVWYDQIGSFKKEVVLKHRNSIPHFDDLFIEEYVNAITCKELLKKYDIRKLDLLHIDTEGYDYEIIKMLPLKEVEIEFIMFEHKHLIEEEYNEAVKLLRTNDYKVNKRGDADTIAIKKNILGDLIAGSK